MLPFFLRLLYVFPWALASGALKQFQTGAVWFQIDVHSNKLLQFLICLTLSFSHSQVYYWRSNREGRNSWPSVQHLTEEMFKLLRSSVKPSSRELGLSSVVVRLLIVKDKINRIWFPYWAHKTFKVQPRPLSAKRS